MIARSSLRYEVRDRAAVITYDRQARRNAWDVPMYRDVVLAVEEANADDAVAAIIFTHLGPVYCSGTDFKAEPEPKDPVTGRRPSVATLSMDQESGWLELMARSKPSIAAIRGQAMGIGVTQILPMDIRVGARSSSYNFPFLAVGVMPELGCTALLPRLVGAGRALDICLTAARIDAEEAYRIGLISRLVPDEHLLDEAFEIAGRIAAFPTLQVNLTRRLFAQNATEGDPKVVLRREVEAFVAMFRAAKAAQAPRSP